MDIDAQIRRMSENSLVRKALVDFLAEWEAAIGGSTDSPRYGPLAEKADAFIEVIMALAVQRLREDMREPSKVVAPPFAPTEKGTIDLVEMTKRLGLPGEDQTAVQAFSGEDYGHMWTEAEAEELIEAWNAAARDSAS